MKHLFTDEERAALRAACQRPEDGERVLVWAQTIRANQQLLQILLDGYGQAEVDEAGRVQVKGRRLPGLEEVK